MGILKPNRSIMGILNRTRLVRTSYGVQYTIQKPTKKILKRSRVPGAFCFRFGEYTMAANIRNAHS